MAIEEEASKVTGETVETTLTEAMAQAEQCLRLIVSAKETPGRCLDSLEKIPSPIGDYTHHLARRGSSCPPDHHRRSQKKLASVFSHADLKALDALKTARQLHASLAAMGGIDIGSEVSSAL